MTETRIRAILQELVEDNPFACRAILRVLSVGFTTGVPTLAVTCDERPRLLINLAFVSEHCRTDEHVKAVILHEFLHVLLRHTEEKREITPARHLACDAVINAIIHRQCGEAHSSMMSAYYAAARGVMVTAIAIDPPGDVLTPLQSFYIVRIQQHRFALNIGTLLEWPLLVSLIVPFAFPVLAAWRALKDPR